MSIQSTQCGCGVKIRCEQFPSDYKRGMWLKRRLDECGVPRISISSNQAPRIGIESAKELRAWLDDAIEWMESDSPSRGHEERRLRQALEMVARDMGYEVPQNRP